MASLAETASKTILTYFPTGFLEAALVPRRPLRQLQPACEVAKNTRSRALRSGGGEACCRRRRADGLHVVLHSPAPRGWFCWFSGKSGLKDKHKAGH